MEEKKLTDEEIIEAYSNCANHYDCFDCLLMEEALRRISICREVVHRLQAENERLTEKYENMHAEIILLNEEKFKLKRQASILLSEKGFILAERAVIREQAVKDTAKEILQELWDETEPLNESHKWVRLRIKNIASRKGVEVE